MFYYTSLFVHILAQSNPKSIFLTERQFQQINVNVSSAQHNSYYFVEEESEEERNAQLMEEHNLYKHLTNDFRRSDLVWPKHANNEHRLRMLQNYA